MNLIKNIHGWISPSKKSTLSVKNDFTRESINRDQNFITGFSHWKTTPKFQQVAKLIRNLEAENFAENGSALQIRHYSDRGIEGIVIKSIPGMETEEYRYLLDQLKEMTLNLKYRFYRSLLEKKETNNRKSLIEEYYLKPAIQSTQNPLIQEYGNITLRLMMINNRFHFLKIISTTYSGYNYKTPKPFKEFIRQIFR